MSRIQEINQKEKKKESKIAWMKRSRVKTELTQVNLANVIPSPCSLFKLRNRFLRKILPTKRSQSAFKD